jgi:putative ABC transport system permease protein
MVKLWLDGRGTPLRFTDLLRFALATLVQQKVRTLLTTLGVFLGTFVLVISVSIGTGLRERAMALFRQNDQLRKIEVRPEYFRSEEEVPQGELEVKGEMDDAKRKRLREALSRRWFMHHARAPRTPLSQERLAQIAALEHVTAVTPEIDMPGRAVFADHVEDVSTGAVPYNSPRLRKRLVAGDGFVAADQRAVVVSEFLLYLWGIVDDADVPSVLGKKLRLEFRDDPGRPNQLLFLLSPGTGDASIAEKQALEKAVQQLPAALDKMDLTPAERATLRKLLERPPPQRRVGQNPTIAEEFTIAGVVRLPVEEDQERGFFRWDPSLYADVILPVQSAEEMVFRLPYVQEHGANSATVTVDDEANVEAVAAQIQEMGLNQFSLAEIAKKVKLNLLLISLGTGFVAGMALLVAGLGITNTMLMTVLERTHEIGVMKAVGARDVHVQLIFLIEGALIGLAGGGLGLLAAWLTSFPLDALARSIVAQQTGTKLTESLFVFPAWLTLGVLGFAVLITTLAAVYPARRAARVNPVTALRHE